MDELKSKLKKLSVNPFKKTAKGAFKGTGHVLGSAAPQAPSSAGAGSGASTSDRYAQQQQPGQQLRQPGLRPAQPSPEAPPQPPASAAQAPSGLTARSSTAVSTAAVATTHQAASAPAALPAPAARPAPAAQQPAPSAAPAPAPPAAFSAEPGGLPGLGSAAAEFDAGPPSPDSQEAVEAAVGQLASDPHAGAAADVLARLLRNVTASPGDPKFRRLRLSNPRIQQAVVEAAGGVELLLACGFEIVFEEPAAGMAGPSEGETQGFAVLDPAADLRPLRHALLLLQPLLSPSAATPQQPQQLQQPAAPVTTPALPASGAGGRSSTGGTSMQPPAQPQPPQRLRPERVWDAPRPRATTVLLPQSPATDMPEWFFARTGAELKAAFLSAVRRREQDQTLMTRAARERLRAGNAPAAATHALVKVRLPEGMYLQGEFNPGEPVAAVFAWVSDCLADPGCTYELVLPSSRKPLAAAGQSVREADLLPAVTLNFRWTGQSAADMQTMPALRPDLLRRAQAGEQGR